MQLRATSLSAGSSAIGAKQSSIAKMVSALRRIGGSLWMVDNAFSGAYVDNVGTQPVTAYADLLGLTTDRLGVLGSNLFTGTYALGASTTATYSGGEATATFGGTVLASANNWLSIPGNTAAGTFSVIEYWATYVSGGNLEVGSTWQVGDTITAASNGGVRRRYTTRVRTGYAGIGLGPASFGATSAGSVWKVEVISVRELTGNHATQSAVASKPSVQRVPKRTRGPVNQLLWSDFQNGVTDAPTRSGLVTASALAGYGGALAFGHDGSTSSYAYKSFTYTVGLTYTFAAVVAMDDGNAPTFATVFDGTSAANSFAIFTGGAVVDPRTITATLISTGLYLVCGTYIASGVGTNTGVIKYNANSNRTFKVTRYGLFAGTVTAAKIVDGGGIPLTTTTALPNVTEWANVISFDGSNDFLQTSITTGNEGWVCAGVTSNSYAVTKTIFWTGANGPSEAGATLRVLGGGVVQMVTCDGTAQAASSGGANAATGTPQVIEGGWNATTLRAAVDGAEATAPNTRGGASTQTAKIGDAASGQWFNGPMHAIAYAPVLPSNADRKIIRNGIAALQGRTL